VTKFNHASRLSGRSCAINTEHNSLSTEYIDINECSNHTLNECHPDGYCENEVPGYFCGCNPGYTGSGFNCTG